MTDDPWNDEWEREQATFRGRAEVLGVRIQLLREAIVQDTPRPLRPVIRWLLRRS
jgi:hypothetical protein